MAVTQAGSVDRVAIGSTANTGTVSSTLTVPSDAEIVIVGVSGYQGTAGGYAGMTFTKGGVDTAMTAVPGGDSNNTRWQSKMFWLAAPDTGTNKTLKWDWIGTGASADGSMLFGVTYWKGINTSSPVRDSDGCAPTNVKPATTPTLTAQNGDLIVAWTGFTSGGTVDSWTNLTLLQNMVAGAGGNDGAWATGSPSGDTTVAVATGTGWDEGSLSAIVLEPAAGAAYTLTAAQGAVALAGQAAALRNARMAAAGQGTFTLTGQAAGLRGARVTSAAQGTLTLSGVAAGLVHAPREALTLIAAAGAFVLTGKAVTLRYQATQTRRVVDYSALLFDPVYAELGVAAVFAADGTAGEVALTVIDDTRPKSLMSGSAEMRGVGPGAFARIPELDENGIARDDYLDATLTFNGRSWTVRSYELRGSPNGEDLGEVRFLLKEMPAVQAMKDITDIVVIDG